MANDPRIEGIDILIIEGNNLYKKFPQGKERKSPELIRDFKSWLNNCDQYLIEEFDEVNRYAYSFFKLVAKKHKTNRNPRKYLVNLGVRLLKELKKYLIKYPDYIKDNKISAFKQIETICNNFHKVAHHIGEKRKPRSSYKIDNESDTQDLFHSMLCLFFEDIRKDEPTPSLAGRSAKIDFLLKKDKIGIEIKFGRTGKEDQAARISKELRDDMDLYEEHADCKTLICFIYDPKKLVENPSGLKADLLKKTKPTFKVDVFIST